MTQSNLDEIGLALEMAKEAARMCRSLTGRPLGITGEVAEFEAARLLDLELADVRQAGHDAVRHDGGNRVRIQIKGRRIAGDAKPGQRIGGIRFNHDWDRVLIVILD